MIINQQVGITILSPLRTLSFSYPNFTENYNASGYSALPTANPGSAGAQVSYTVQTSDLPTMQGRVVGTPITTGAILTGCQNTTASAITVYCYAYRNGVAIANTSVSVAAGNYVTFHSRFSPLNAGDVVTIAMYASAAGVNFIYWTSAIMEYSKVFLETVTNTTVFMPITMPGNTYPYTAPSIAPAQGNPHFNSNTPVSLTTSMGSYPLISRNMGYVVDQGSSGMFVGATDSNQVNANTSATYMPLYNGYERLATFTYRTVNTKA